MYDPIVGRWLEQDPTGFEAGDSNLYRYVENDPTNAFDPSGLKLVVANHEIKDATDQMYMKILDPIINDKTMKEELIAASEILQTMIKSPVEKKTYSYNNIDDIAKEIKLRIYMVIAAKEWDKAAREGRLAFPEGNTPISFTGSSIIASTKVKMTIDGQERELTGIGLKGGTPSKAIAALRGAKKESPVVADCSSTVALVIQAALQMYLGSESYDRLFSKDNPFVIAGPYGINRFITLPEGKTDLLPGDTSVFTNSGAKKAAFKFENTIYLGDNTYYAPGVGIKSYNDLVKWLRDRSNTGIVVPAQGTGRIKVP